MNSYLLILKSLFLNKLRFDTDKSKRSFIALIVILGLAYAVLLSVIISGMFAFREILSISQLSQTVYFIVLLTASLIVLIFGIVYLVVTLYFSKDTDFFSVLPVKPSIVFVAKLSYVYISETVIVAVFVLPLLIVFGAIIGASAVYYLITVAMIAIMPSFPLVVAAIFTMLVLLFADKLKNRGLITLIFFLLLGCGIFGLYGWFVTMLTSLNSEMIFAAMNAIEVIPYVFYPLTALSRAACGVDGFGLGYKISALCDLTIFFGCSTAALCLLMLLSKFLYARAAKANNQTYTSKSKNRVFKYSNSIWAIIKREYVSSMRTTQIAFQCYFSLLLPIMMAVILGMMFGNMSDTLSSIEEDIGLDYRLLFISANAMLWISVEILATGAATTFSREGNAMASLKILPVDIGTIIKAKVCAWLILAIPSAMISVAIVNAFLFDATFVWLSVFSVVPLAGTFIVFGVLWDLTSPKLKWTDPIQAVKHNGHCTMGQMMAFSGGAVSMFGTSSLFSSNISFDIISATYWIFVYSALAIFTVVNIILYKKAETYYKRIEI